MKENGMVNSLKITIATLLVSFALSAQAQNDDSSSTPFSPAQPYMLGDWGGARSKLEKKGVTFSLVSVNDLLRENQGGTANWSRVRGTVDIDFGKAELVSGLKFHITGLWQAGGNLGSYMGSIANPSSLVSANTARLDSWWFEQSLAHNKLS